MTLLCTPVVTIDGSLATYFEVLLTADVLAVVAVNLSPGTLYTCDIAQDATGAHAFPWEQSGSFEAAPPISAAALTRTTQTFLATPFQTLAPIQNGATNQG